MLFYNIVCIFQMDFFSKSKGGKNSDPGTYGGNEKCFNLRSSQ